MDRSSSSSSDGVCGYQEVLNYLNMSKDNVLYTMARPVKNHTQPTVVKLTILLYGILDVVSGLKPNKKNCLYFSVSIKSPKGFHTCLFVHRKKPIRRSSLIFGSAWWVSSSPSPSFSLLFHFLLWWCFLSPPYFPMQNWINDHISWNDSEFCGINTIPVPTELLWKPDIMIYEM